MSEDLVLVSRMGPAGLTFVPLDASSFLISSNSSLNRARINSQSPALSSTISSLNLGDRSSPLPFRKGVSLVNRSALSYLKSPTGIWWFSGSLFSLLRTGLTVPGTVPLGTSA
eukprot:GHVT01060324.1.p2 GENE.GHVT01060324.1~~GHVT01060324.1.p2  ORF type:complete len:113 (-),score=0.18 GHVT01060324.1:25-363(-)